MNLVIITIEKSQEKMSINIPETHKKRVVIIGGGFAGLKFINALKNRGYQLILLDKTNYHQFQPLLYQVATSGLSPEDIAFPFRKDFQSFDDLHFRLTAVSRIIPERNTVETTIGTIRYDYLVIATGTETNYYSMANIEANAMSMKSVMEAIELKNRILLNLENALSVQNDMERKCLLNVVIVGGGATGVEIAGASAEMKRYIFRKDYPDLNLDDVNIYLLEGASRLLKSMSEKSSDEAYRILTKMGVIVRLNTSVTDYTNNSVYLNNGDRIPTKTLIWVSGVTGRRIEGLSEECYQRGDRLITDPYNRLGGYDNIFAIGDICFQCDERYPTGYPQVAQVAIQQGRLLAKNICRLEKGELPTPFHYRNKGSMATIGRNRAVVEINRFELQGLFAWFIWMTVHLISILGVKNKIQIVINWLWCYII